MEEALRKLHGKGVVSAKKAFGTQSKDGTQRAEALKAFQTQAGVDVSTGACGREAGGREGWYSWAGCGHAWRAGMLGHSCHVATLGPRWGHAGATLSLGPR